MKLKKSIIGSLTFFVLLLLFTVNVFASGGVENRINSILAQFPSGSYFTANGQACNHSSGSTCSNCQLSSVLRAKGISFDTSKYSDGWTCYAFAVYCYGTIFEQNYRNAIGVTSSGIVSSNAGLYNAFKQAKMGDFVYCMKGESVNHYAIFISCDANGVTLLHNNIGGNGKVGTIRYGYVPYSNLRGAGYGYNRVDIYRAPNYDSINGAVDSFISYLERPASGGNYSGPIAILGYALHKNGIRNVTAWVNGQVMGCSMYNSPDVAKVYPGYPTGNEGFQTQIPISCLKEGENEIGIYAYEKDDTPHLIASHKFNWSSFVCKLESPVQNGSYDGTLSIQGYTLHKNGIKNVTAWVNGQVMDCPMYERKEIATKYPGYPTGKEGFKTEIPLSCLKNGENEIGVFAYEPNGGTHNIASYKFNYVKESQKPIISNVKITDLTSAGYTVTCDVNASEGLSSVQFPTWSHTNGQDDLVWHEGTISGNKATCKINISDHKRYVNCTYQTDIYAYDKAGNCTTYINRLFPYIDATSPTISDVEVVDVSETGYTVKCKVTDDHSKIARVQFPTWFEEDNPFNADWSWKTSATYSGKLEDGKYVFRVNTNKYKNKTGKYHTDIYAWDEYGNQSKCYTTETIITKAHKHEYISSIKKPATCTEPGIRLYTCKDNDDSYEEEIPATGHQHTELRNVKAATCAQEGYTGDTYCKDCNTKLATGKSIAKKDHTWDSGKITTAATCSGKGIKTYTCIGCNATRTEEIPATGHQHTELRNVKAATCAQEGYTGDTYCKDCNTKLATGKSIAKKDHTWDAGKITTVATCNGKGIKTYTCTECNATRTEEIPSTGHQHTELRNVKAATCAQEGYTGDTYCKDCNTKLTAGKVLPKTDHTWDSGKVTQNATCTTKGIKTFTCTVCKSTRIEEIPATGHVNKITKFVKAASCKSEGYTGDVYCQDCGTLIEEGKVIPKADHVWNKGEITTPATCTTKGIKTYTCASCGTTKTEAIAATGHGATEIRNKKDATTTSEGYTGDIYCTICNQKISSGKKIAKLTPQTATPGKTIKDKSTNGVYKVLKDGVSVEFTKPVYRKASVRIPDTIKVNGITCKVTGISANAFKNNKSLKSVTIGRNVTVIGTNAFYGCKKLSKVSGGNGIVKIGHRAFANCISLSKITIPGSVRSIGKQAFCNCKKLRSITINTSTLSDKTVGSKAFAGTYKNPTVKVPAKQMKAYKKLLKARGMSSKAVYRK